MSQWSAATNQAVAITGTGLVTCLGLDRLSTWRGVCELRNGLGPLTVLEQPTAPEKGGGQAPPLPVDFVPDLPREVRYLRYVLRAAIWEAGIERDRPYAPHRCGLLMGTTLHGMPAAGRYLRNNDPRELRAFLAPTVLRVAADALGFTGFSASTCSACSSGLSSVALAITLLNSGELDLVIAGGYDVMSEYTYAGFNSLRLVAEGPPRPFSPDRKGLNLAEGYAAVVLERSEDAQRRGAGVIATILASWESADAHHLTQPHPSGDGASRAMKSALDRARLSVGDIDLICAHATATPDNDGAEYLALRNTFGERLAQTPCVAFKSHLGHTLGAAGAVELILTATAINQGVIPPTRGAMPRLAGEGFEDLRLEAAPRPAAVRTSINVSLGFGGANTCVVIGRPQVYAGTSLVHASPASPEHREVLVTGVGVVVPGAVGNAAFVDLVNRGGDSAPPPRTGEVGDESLISLIQSRRVRRMSQYVKLTLAASTLAIRDGSGDGDLRWAETMSAILGTAHGSVQFSSSFYRQVVVEGIEAANPMLFAEGVPNGGAAHLSLMLGMKGSCQTILGTRTAGLDALMLAWLRVRCGVWDRAIVCAAEEWSDLADSSYVSCGLYDPHRRGGLPFGSPSGFVSGAGGVAILLESKDAALARGVSARGRIDSCASACFPVEQPRAAVDAGIRVLGKIGAPMHLISSANATWLDGIESAALGSGPNGNSRVVSCLYGYIAESFSAAPLASMAWFLLTGRLPRLLGGSREMGGWKPATGSECVDSIGVICSDYNGLWAGSRVSTDAARVGVF